MQTLQSMKAHENLKTTFGSHHHFGCGSKGSHPKRPQGYFGFIKKRTKTKRPQKKHAFSPHKGGYLDPFFKKISKTSQLSLTHEDRLICLRQALWSIQRRQRPSAAHEHFAAWLPRSPTTDAIVALLADLCWVSNPVWGRSRLGGSRS